MITLVLGGSRSGKSEVAEALAAEIGGLVTYVATGSPSDDAMAERIRAHRDRRPPSWKTAEAGPDLARVLHGIEGLALVDALGTWVAATPDFEVDIAALVDALITRTGDTIVVSDEVGMGVHPPTEIGVAFRDVLGTVNRRVADASDRVVLVVAGRVLELE